MSFEQALERGLARAQQGAIVEQVAAGVARQAQLGQDQDARAGTRGGVDALQNGRGVARDVAHANLGRGGRDAWKKPSFARAAPVPASVSLVSSMQAS